jgi:hypothetical protein
VLEASGFELKKIHTASGAKICILEATCA